jgi:hypothetical protein
MALDGRYGELFITANCLIQPLQHALPKLALDGVWQVRTLVVAFHLNTQNKCGLREGRQNY